MNWNLLTENYEKLIAIPIILIASSAFFLYYNYSTEENLLDRSFGLEGGIKITLTTDEDVSKLVSKLNRMGINNKLFNIPSGKRLVINLDQEVEEKVILEEVGKYVPKDSIQIIHVKPKSQLLVKAKKIAPFVLLAAIVAVFLFFRSFPPTLSMSLNIIFNILFILGMMAFFEIQLSPATLCGIGMILAFSFQDDFLLYSHVKRESEKLDKGIIKATKTGTMMSIVMLIIALGLFLVPERALRQVGTVLLFGLPADYSFTWIQSAGIIKFFSER